MARKKKTSTRPKLQLTKWLRNIPWGNAARGSLALLWLLGIAGIAAVCWYGVPRLQAHVAEHASIDSIEIYFVDPPAWVRGDLELHLVRTIEPILRRDPFDREMLATVRRDLLATGWFEDIKQVRRVRNDRIDIHSEFVDPYAVVRDRDGDHLVDPRGKLLPRTFPQGEAEKFTVITGSRFPRPGRPGMQWEGADLTAALRLLHLIETQPWREQVAAINITGVIRGEPLRIVTDRGSRIIWGSAPGEESALEALAPLKLHYLNYLAREHGHIDMGHTGTLDITSITSVNQSAE